jgi:hypothetical protein
VARFQYTPAHGRTEGIGCAGEIRISENEDYDKWAIDILVKFRDNENLQLLTGQRQSGGVRGLSFCGFFFERLLLPGTFLDHYHVSHEFDGGSPSALFPGRRD